MDCKHCGTEIKAIFDGLGPAKNYTHVESRTIGCIETDSETGIPVRFTGERAWPKPGEEVTFSMGSSGVKS